MRTPYTESFLSMPTQARAQQQLVGREMEEIKKLRHQCKADKTQELQSKHQQYVTSSLMTMPLCASTRLLVLAA